RPPAASSRTSRPGWSTGTRCTRAARCSCAGSTASARSPTGTSSSPATAAGGRSRSCPCHPGRLSVEPRAMRDPVSQSALEALPIFPLPDVVLFPGAVLPLHIFEPRYREMTADLLAAHGLLALARLRPGYE